MPKKRYEEFFLIILVILLFASIANGSDLSRKREVIDVDSLRTVIRIKQDSLSQLKSMQLHRQDEFQSINAKIYRYKENKGSNPLKDYRLQNELKKSRKMADQIEKNKIQINSLENELQHLYQVAIKQIDRKIQNNLANSKNALNQTKKPSDFETIQNLEKEKADYYNRLKAINDVDEDWKKLRIEPGDTRQRIQMKTAILQDKLANIELVIQQRKQRLQELDKDRQVYQEMMGFYVDLKLAVDEEQEFFDRNRVDELQDQIDSIDKKRKELRQEIHKMSANADTLKNKVVIFKNAAQNQK